MTISVKKSSFFVRGLPVGAERTTGYLHHAVFSRGSEFSICFGIGDREHAGIQDSIHEPAKILFKFDQKGLKILLNLWSRAFGDFEADLGFSDSASVVHLKPCFRTVIRSLK